MTDKRIYIAVRVSPALAAKIRALAEVEQRSVSAQAGLLLEKAIKDK